MLLFVAIGRRSHGEQLDVAGLAATAWPFLVGLAAGWAVARAWRRPFGIGVGALAWIVTVAAGMLLRLLSGQGVQFGFVVVATIVLGAFLVGWRSLLEAVRRRSTRPRRR